MPSVSDLETSLEKLLEDSKALSDGFVAVIKHFEWKE